MIHATVKFNEEHLKSILGTALDSAYGSSWYWIVEENLKVNILIDKEHNPKSIEIVDAPPEFLLNTRHKLIRRIVDLTALAEAIAECISEGMVYDFENLDGEGADMFLQYAFFGEVVYG